MAARESGLRDNGLPAKENALFKSIVKYYETKQYKKGLKAADTVLKKFAEHGETNAMKVRWGWLRRVRPPSHGLILNCMERKAEAYELVRKGVKSDIKSHVCWHVYGLLYRSDREYLQAIKCYRSALRWDPENIQILRDLSMLQVQMRDLDGFVQTRQQLLTLKPTNRNNWFSFALSQQLRGRHKQEGSLAKLAFSVIRAELLHASLDVVILTSLVVKLALTTIRALGVVDAYEATLEGSPENDYEHSEMLLYKNLLFEEGGMLHEALEHLDKSEHMLVDKLFYHEKKAELLAATLKQNDFVERWAGVHASEDVEKVLGPLYKELQAEFPRSVICKRLPLDFARSASYFREVAADYIIPLIRKGVPSLFADVKPLYVDPQKVEVLGALFRSWLEQLELDGKLPGEAEPELPSSLLWVLVLYAQHLDKVRDTKGALAMMDRAIEHTPTLLDLYMFKLATSCSTPLGSDDWHAFQARIFKHAGAPQAASEQMEIARKMDLADRYLNTNWCLTPQDGENSSNLFDMQCMWYELEVARSFLRQVRACCEVEKRSCSAYRGVRGVHRHPDERTPLFTHTSEWGCVSCVGLLLSSGIRKMTLRAYVRLLRLEDHIYGHNFFVQAACGIIDTYLSRDLPPSREQLSSSPPDCQLTLIADKPKLSSSEAIEAESDEMSAAERKKAESKRRKAEAKAKAEADAKAKAE
ncbi:MAG: hypothetical protein SGPRY_001338, partial [Prymnesium sp.]